LSQTITSVEEARPSYAIVKATFCIGIVLFATANLFYWLNISQFYNIGAPWVYSYISLLIVSLASLSIGVSAFYYFFVQQKISPVSVDSSRAVQWRVVRIVSDAIFREKKLFISATVIYAVVFSFLDGILVYQPQVNFVTYYAASVPTWRVLTCCGTPAYVPVGLIYLPAQHIGVELYPLSVLLMLVVSLLIGLNLSLLVRAFRASRSSSGKTSEKKGVVGSILGAAVGLFAGCPTCAAAFFLSMIAGTGATAFSTLIAKYQPLIFTLTLPFLAFSIFYQAKSITTILAGCEPKVDLK
jgi:hypothetical protein